jgi:hypothetical protein
VGQSEQRSLWPGTIETIGDEEGGGAEERLGACERRAAGERLADDEWRYLASGFRAASRQAGDSCTAGKPAN